MLHSIKAKKILGMIVKLDISKAYNTTNWQFIRSMVTDFGFNVEWIEWIMNLVSLALFSILVNRVPSGLIKASRGIRQGDPLSHFLFIHGAEGLGGSIAALRDNNYIRGLRVHLTVDKQTHQ